MAWPVLRILLARSRRCWRARLAEFRLPLAGLLALLAFCFFATDNQPLPGSLYAAKPGGLTSGLRAAWFLFFPVFGLVAWRLSRRFGLGPLAPLLSLSMLAWFSVLGVSDGLDDFLVGWANVVYGLLLFLLLLPLVPFYGLVD